MKKFKGKIIAIIVGGITLLVGNMDVNAAPVNTAFVDDNFYNCIIDELNTENIDAKNDRTYTYNAPDSELSQLTTLNCTGDSIASAAGIAKLTGLTHLDLSDNSLTVLDLTANTALTYLDLRDNDFVRRIDVNQGTPYDLSQDNSIVVFPSNKIATLSVASYVGYNEQLATVSTTGIIDNVLANGELQIDITYANSGFANNSFYYLETILATTICPNPTTGISTIYGIMLVVLALGVGAYISVKGRTKFPQV